MEIPGRYDSEAKLTARLDAIFATVRGAARRGTEPNWQEVEDQAAKAIEDEQLAVFIFMLLFWWDDWSRRASLEPGLFDADSASRLGSDWAGANARSVARAMADNIRSEMQGAAGSGVSLLDRAPTRSRAEVISATEITKAGSKAQEVGKGEIERRIGIRLISYWVTERDAKVCPICRPLDGQPQEVWAGLFHQFGPPAHPNCRCHTEERMQDWEP